MSIKSALRSSVKRARRKAFEAVGSDRFSRMGQHDIEQKFLRIFGTAPGVFIEAGANDGLNFSTTYWLERFHGWRGLLVEPVPQVAEMCRLNRPRATVVNAALVPTSDIQTVKVAAIGLYGYVTGHFSDADHEEKHRKSGVLHANLPPDHVIQDIEVPARTLESVLDEVNMGPVDLFTLDVEGYEVSVLRGMNMDKYRPRYLMVEALGPEKLLAAFGEHYQFVEHITPQDVLLKAKHLG